MESTEYKKIEEFEKDYWWHQGRLHLLKSLIPKYLNNKSSLELFEVGCGTGGTMALLSSLGNAKGIDISEEAIGFCKSKGIENVFCGDISTFNLDKFYGKFDGVFALDVLEHIQDDVMVLKKLRELMKPEGKIFITVPAHKYLWSEHDEANQHKRRYSSVELKYKLSLAGLIPEKHSYFVAIPFFPMFIYRMWNNFFVHSPIPKSSYVRLPLFFNSLGYQILKFETWFFDRMTLPIGTTLVIIANKGIVN